MNIPKLAGMLLSAPMGKLLELIITNMRVKIAFDVKSCIISEDFCDYNSELQMFY